MTTREMQFLEIVIIPFPGVTYSFAKKSFSFDTGGNGIRNAGRKRFSLFEITASKFYEFYLL